MHYVNETLAKHSSRRPVCLSAPSQSPDFSLALFLKSTKPLQWAAVAFTAVFPHNCGSVFMHSPLDEASDMVTRFISGSNGFDAKTFIRIPGISPLLMNYSLALNDSLLLSRLLIVRSFFSSFFNFFFIRGTFQ